MLVFAHKKEAQAFLGNNGFAEKIFLMDNVYKNNSGYLLITGQGLENASQKLKAFLIDKYAEIKRVINMGTAGRINDQVKTDNIYAIHKVFAPEISQTAFQSSSRNSKIGCVSVKQPISSQVLKNLDASVCLVDMELWSIASVVNAYGIPFDAYKIVSDNAKDTADKQVIIKRAHFFSTKLWEFYREICRK